MLNSSGPSPRSMCQTRVKYAPVVLRRKNSLYFILYVLYYILHLLFVALGCLRGSLSDCCVMKCTVVVVAVVVVVSILGTTTCGFVFYF